jgi:hypothetical protein
MARFAGSWSRSGDHFHGQWKWSPGHHRRNERCETRPSAVCAAHPSQAPCVPRSLGNPVGNRGS